MTPLESRTVGNTGLVAVGVLLIANLLHPLDGTTEMYADAVLFMEKMDTFWVVLHLVLAVPFLVVPWIVWAWTQTLSGEVARLWGRAAWMATLGGSAVGIVHLAGVDGIALASFRDVVEASDFADAEVAAAGALLKLHLATLLGWTLTMWFGAQLLIGVAALVDRPRRRIGWLAVVGAVFALAAVLVTAVEGQWTTLSEPLLLRPSTIAFTIWMLVASVQLRRAGTTDVAGRQPQP